MRKGVNTRRTDRPIGHSGGSPDKLIYNAAEAAEMLGLGDRGNPVEAMRNLRRSGRIGAVMVCGRWAYRRQDLLRYLETCRRYDPVI